MQHTNVFSSVDNIEASTVRLHQYRHYPEWLNRKLDTRRHLQSHRSLPIWLSPLALVAACGPQDDAEQSTNDQTTQPTLDIFYSSVLNLETQQEITLPAEYQGGYDIYQSISPHLTVLGFSMGLPASIIFEVEQQFEVLIMPSWFTELPFLPQIQITINGEQITSQVLENSVNIGFARNWAQIDVGGDMQYAIADTGHEFRSQDYETWPFGHVWLASIDTNGQFQLSAIPTDANAFYHDIDVGDINGDGLDDIIALNMGVKEGGDPYMLHVFYQEDDGSFTQDVGFFAFSDAHKWLGSGSVALTDIDGDQTLEIVHGGYVRDGNGIDFWDWEHQFLVWKRNDAGEFELAFAAPRSGKAADMGSANIYSSDIDLDGDLDLILYMEMGAAISDISGTVASGEVGTETRGVQVWENKGDNTFSNQTDYWVEQSVWLGSEFSPRDFTLIDLNSDGYDDLFVSLYGGNIFQEYGELNVGSAIFLNIGGEYFDHLEDIPELTIPIQGGAKDPSYVRLLDVTDDGFSLFVMNSDQTIGTVEVLNSDLAMWV